MGLALIAGQGALPRAVLKALPTRPVVCALEGSLPDQITADIVFPLERLGGLLTDLRAKGVRDICMCGRVARPGLSVWRLDRATLRLLPGILRALRRGDDGALRIVIGILEEAGFAVRAAHEVAPDLLPPAGVPTRATVPDTAVQAAVLGDTVSQDQAQRDLGQACVLRADTVLARETDDGTDAMLAALKGGAQGGVLYKAPKPGQDRRADLPVIGPETAKRAAEAQLAGLIIEASGVMVLDRARVLDCLDAAGLFLWIRERPM